MGTTKQASRSRGNGVVSKTAWAGLAVHTITLASGARVKVRFPNVALLLAGDAVPEELRGEAMRKVSEELFASLDQPDAAGGLTEETLKQFDDYHRFLISRSLVEPTLTYDELEEGRPTRPPQEDLDLLVEILVRGRDTDAAGVRLGVEPLDRWATFRHHHGCDESCEACAKVIDAFSSVDVGAL